MKVLLSSQCLSLTGMLERGLGYHLEHRKNGFFSKRNQKGFVPPDGHWRFIVLCAELAQNGLYISDIEVGWYELHESLKEAHHFIAAQNVRRNGEEALKLTYNARDILNLKTTFSL